jgi:hypothetical protein
LLQDMVSYSDAKIHTERDGGFPSFWLHWLAVSVYNQE